MRLIYCKSTEKRARKFQIYTCIMQKDDKEKIVIKKPVYFEGKDHIEKIYKNYQLLNNIYPNQVARCNRVDNGISYTYIEGESYEQQVKDRLQKDENFENWKNVLGEWKNLLIGNKNNIVIFDNGQEFQNIFGNAEELLGDTALAITNFDGIGENIIWSNENLYFIDYEWVFDFPIPLEFCFYRIVEQFYQNNKRYFEHGKLLRAAGLMDNKKIEIYERLLDNFSLYVSLDDKNNVQYENLGKFFKTPQNVIYNAMCNQRFSFPIDKIAKGKRIVLYGAGDVGMSYYQELQQRKEYVLVNWIDKKYKKYREGGYNVSPIDKINEREYDYVLLAIYNERIAKEIIDELNALGIDNNKIVWTKPQSK